MTPTTKNLTAQLQTLRVNAVLDLETWRAVLVEYERLEDPIGAARARLDIARVQLLIFNIDALLERPEGQA